MTSIGSTAAATSVARSLTSTAPRPRRPDVPGVLLLQPAVHARRPAAPARRRDLNGVPVFADRGDRLPDLRRCRRTPPRPASLQGISGRSCWRVIVAVVAFPLGIATAVYLEEYAPANRLTRAHRDQHPESGRRARRSSTVSLGSRCSWRCSRSMAAATGATSSPAAPTAGGPGAADRDHHVARGAPRRTDRHPRGGLRRRRVALGGDPQARPAGGLPGHPHGHRAGPVAGARRDRTADPRRRGPRVLLQRLRRPDRPADRAATPRCRSSSIDWARKPQDEFRAACRGGHHVLLVITLFANAVAIYLRNRYSGRW